MQFVQALAVPFFGFAYHHKLVQNEIIKTRDILINFIVMNIYWKKAVMILPLHV